MKIKLYHQFYNSIQSFKKSNIKNPNFIKYIEKQIKIANSNNKITDYEKYRLLSFLFD